MKRICAGILLTVLVGSAYGQIIKQIDPDDIRYRNVDRKTYEIKDHLLNVTVTAGDVKEPQNDPQAAPPADFAPIVRSVNNYYAYGSPMPDRNYNSPDYRYGYNGKEKDDAIKNKSGTSYDFGARMYDPRVGRFLSLDPLAKDYPEQTPYLYAQNNPVNAVDLNGETAFFVTGTTSDHTRWTDPEGTGTDDPTLTVGILGITESTDINSGFNWNELTTLGGGTQAQPVYIGPVRRRNWLFNNKRDRRIAAEALARYVYLNNKKGDPVTLIGHSHGGNVSIQAASILYERYGIQVDLITIATPTYTDPLDPENPLNNPGIKSHIHIWNAIDYVQGGLAGGNTYNNGWTTDIELDASDQYYWFEWLDAHSFDAQYPNEFLARLLNKIEGPDAGPTLDDLEPLPEPGTSGIEYFNERDRQGSTDGDNN